MIIEINTKRSKSQEKLCQRSAGDSGSETPENRIGLAAVTNRSRNGSFDSQGYPKIFSPRYEAVVDAEDFKKIKDGVPPLDLVCEGEDKFAIFSPRIFGEEPATFPDTPLSGFELDDCDKYNVFSPRPAKEVKKEPANPFKVFSPRYPKTAACGSPHTFKSLLSELNAIKGEPFFTPNDPASSSQTFRSPRYSHVISPVKAFDTPLRSGPGFQSTRLIQAN